MRRRNTCSFLILAVLLLAGVRVRAGRSIDEELQLEGAGTRAAVRQLVEKARELEAGGHYRTAATYYRRAADRTRTGGAKAGLILREANCLLEARRFASASSAYKDLVKAYPMHIPYDEVLGQLRSLAECFNRGDASRLGFRNRTRAIEIYQFIVDRAPGTPEAPADLYRLAELQIQDKLAEEAIMSLRDMVRRYPKAPRTADAMLDMARLLLDLGKAGDGDGSWVRQGRQQLLGFLRTYYPELSPWTNEEETALAKLDPQQARRYRYAKLLLQVADERQANRLYEIGEFYVQREHRRPEAADRYLSEAINHYPDTAAKVMAEQLRARLTTSGTTRTEAARTEVASRPEADTVPVQGQQRLPDIVPSEIRTPEEARRITPEAIAKPTKTRPLDLGEGVKKWLLPLEDLSPYLPRKRDEE